MEKTGTMQSVSQRGGTAATDVKAGLVLLFAHDFAELPPAFVLEGGSVVAGREPPPGGLTIPQRAASRLHARFTREGDDWTIVDLDSHNGTLVNGLRVQQARLAPLDQIRIGDAIFKFVPDGAPAFLPYRIDGTTVDGTGQSALPPSSDLVGGLQVRRILWELGAVAGTTLDILVRGETGTGKELVARAVHRASARPGPFCALNCAAIPPALLESELFGYKRGAFTGAHRDKAGLIETANGGTLLLDEIGDLPLDAQAKLLRMIETREVFSVGATIATPVDVRLVCATHRDLSRMVAEGAFRSDLFARINGYTVHLPPLRERKEDLYALVRHFLAQEGRSGLRVGFPFMAALCQYAWPYNVRELRALVRRAVALCRGEELDVTHLSEAVRAALDNYGARAPVGDGSVVPPAPSVRAAPPTEATLRELLARHDGNIASVARELGKDRAQVHRWIRSAGIDPSAYRR